MNNSSQLMRLLLEPSEHASMSFLSVDDLEIDTSELTPLFMEPSEHGQEEGSEVTMLDKNDVVIHACHGGRRNRPEQWHSQNQGFLEHCQTFRNASKIESPQDRRALVELIIVAWEICGGRFVKRIPPYGSDVFVCLADRAEKINKVTIILKREYVTLEPSDIVCEQSPTRAMQTRPATKAYQHLVSLNRFEYQDPRNNGTDNKQHIARRIIAMVHKNGRFVRNDKFGLYKLDENAILEKVQGSLRLKTGRNVTPDMAPRSTPSSEDEEETTFVLE